MIGRNTPIQTTTAYAMRTQSESETHREKAAIDIWLMPFTGIEEALLPCSHDCKVRAQMAEATVPILVTKYVRLHRFLIDEVDEPRLPITGGRRKLSDRNCIEEDRLLDRFRAEISHTSPCESEGSKRRCGIEP